MVSRFGKFLFVNFVFLILLTSIFSYSVIAQIPNSDETASFSFDPEIAGLTPNSFWYFFDFNHDSPQENLHEAGLMVQEGDIESAQIALDNFEQAVRKETDTLDSASIEGVTIEAIDSDSHQGAEIIEGMRINVLHYEEIANAIEQTLVEQAESDSITEAQAEFIVEDLTSEINRIGSEVEHRTHELIEVVVDNSDISNSEARLVFEGEIREQVGDRFNEISSITDVFELEEKIAELKAEADKLREEGNLEQATAVDRLLAMAESHGENCLNSEEDNLQIEAVDHLSAAENIVDNLDRYLEKGEFEDDSYKLMPVWPPPTFEEIRGEILDDKESADKIIGDYDKLKEKYADDPAKLAYIDAEKSKAEKVQQIDEGVLDTWYGEFEGLPEEEITGKIHEKINEQDEVLNGHYEPIGLYVLPGDDGKRESIGEEGVDGEQGAEVIDNGRIEMIETIDPETGEIRKEIVGLYKGEEIEDVKEGGAFALGVPYEDPSTGNIITYDPTGYTVLTEAGVTSTFDYPEGYEPSKEYQYNYGDEAYTFMTDEGEVTFSAVGYKVENTEDNIVREESYADVGEIIKFVDGTSIDSEPTGYVFNDDDGKATAYVYNVESGGYQDVLNGKTFMPPITASHAERTIYDSTTNSYKYEYRGEVWSVSTTGQWTSSSGQQINYNMVPAPVGREHEGSWATPSGKQWTYDSTTSTWTETTTRSSYVVAPNNQYRYDGESGRYVDARGNIVSSTAEGNSNPWSFNQGTGRWVSSETGDEYEPNSGNVIRSDGTVVGPENRPAGQGSEGMPCYGCYHDGEEGTSGQGHTYTYDGGHYSSTPGGGYSYYSSSGEYQGPSVATDSQGNAWTRDSSGTWTSSTVAGQYGSYDPATGTYAGDYYTGGGGYDSGGNYVGGEYGNYDSSGSYTGGAYYGEGGSGSSYSGGGYYGGTGSGGSYSGGGGYDSGGNYVGGDYGSYDSSGSYTGGATYGGTTSGSSGSTTGTTSTSGGDSGSTSSGTSGTSGSTGSTSGGDSGSTSSGTSSGGDSGGGTTGAIISETESASQNPIVIFFKKVGCLFSSSC
ncbi:MAG: hypothetical protein Q7S27_02270 [Nanoarchaeota archaeon]|nr:hypothetical protein [Nanoarchaeota archaeon]